MDAGQLKLNTTGTKSTLSKVSNISFSIDGTTASPFPHECNLGIIMDSTLFFNSHIRNIVKISFFHLQNIAKIRSSLSHIGAVTPIHLYIFSCLDNCNSLFFGISATYKLHKLDLTQNSAARLLTKSSKHTTPVHLDLHWLPITELINYKMLLLTYQFLHYLATPYLSNLLQPHHLSLSQLVNWSSPNPNFRTLGIGHSLGQNSNYGTLSFLLIWKSNS